MMSPCKWLDQKFSGEYFSGQFDHLKKIIERCELIPKNTKVITVAGSNGKGETVRVLADFFKQAGSSCLLITSPHIKKVNERFQFNGENVSDEQLLCAFKSIDEMTKRDQLSYFEFLYLAYLYLAKTFSPDILLQEVGLGGRLDATNAIDADIAVITSISRDHQEFLGEKYCEILIEKLGVSRANSTLVTSLELKYLRQLVKEWCERKKISWWDNFEENLASNEMNFSERNTLLAQKIFEIALMPNPPKVVKRLSSYGKRSFIRDGATWHAYPTHNVDGLRKLIQFLGEELYNKENLVLFAPSKRSFRDLESMGKILLNSFEKEQVRLVHFNHIKALELNRLKELSSKFGIEIVEDIKSFICPEDTNSVLVIGSNYFLGGL